VIADAVRVTSPWRRTLRSLGPVPARRAASSILRRVPVVSDRMGARDAAHRYRTLVAAGHLEPLTSAVVRDVDAYARDVLGDGRHRGDLLVYTASRGAFLEGWMPGTYFDAVVLPRINGRERRALSDRTLTRHLFRADAMPDVGYLVEGRWFDADLRPTSRAAVADAAFARSSGIVVKSAISMHGAGVRIMDRREFDASSYRSDERFAFQYLVEQHPVLAGFGSMAVTTIRITTVLDAGRATACGVVVRIGRAADAIIRSTSAVNVSVGPDGRLGDAAVDHTYRRLDRHPDSGVRFQDVVIPSFADAMKACTLTHERFPQIAVVGWDVAIDRTGAPVLLEANLAYPAIGMAEWASGPHFRDYRWERFAARRPACGA
jgi:hypothetical protein